MKLFRREMFLLLILLLSCMLLGAGDIDVYFGTIRTLHENRLTLMLNDGREKNIKLNDETKAFVSGRIVPFTRIKPNSHVQAAVNGDGICLQIVVEEGPK